MIFNSWEFIALFALVFITYFLVRERSKKYVLIASSAIFIGYNHIGFLAIATTSTLLTYGFGLWIDKKSEEKQRKQVYIFSLISQLVILVLFKYFGFLETNAKYIIELFGVEFNKTIASTFVPLGISFYTFQSISYLTEIYWEEIEAEKQIANFMLYMLFFMKFLSGPIERAEKFIPQIQKDKLFNYEQVTGGLKLIGIGLFKKLMIADRLAPILNDVFSSVQDYSGAQLIVSTVLYPIQLYADFSGYTDIAIGGALILGYQLSPNFNRPFTAESLTEFWRRWHMTLSFWVRDYLYEPIAMKKRNWGRWGIIYALITTFILLGLWHGGSWNFIIYGAIQGIVIAYEMIFAKSRTHFFNRLPSGFVKGYNITRTYLIFSLSLLFFKIEGLSDVAYTLSHIGSGLHSNYTELNLGLTDHNLIMCLSSIILMFIYEAISNKKDLKLYFNKKPLALRWAIYYLLIIIVFCNGAFGNENFIYLQF